MSRMAALVVLIAGVLSSLGTTPSAQQKAVRPGPVGPVSAEDARSHVIAALDRMTGDETLEFGGRQLTRARFGPSWRSSRPVQGRSGRSAPPRCGWSSSEAAG